MNDNICSWAKKSEIEYEYHKNEWGKPSYNDKYLFEMLILEGAQAGLSWRTILEKRKYYKLAFDDFNPSKVAKYNEEKVEELLNNKNIIRNRRKIESTIKNANEFLKVQEEFGSFSKYIWSFTNNMQIVNNWEDENDVPAKSQLSEKISKDLKKRGFSFVGPVIIYSYLQAIGIIDDHLIYCKNSY